MGRPTRRSIACGSSSLGPILAAAKQLEQGEKADTRSVVRHLKPVAKLEMNIEWPDAVAVTMNTLFNGLVDIVLELDTLSKTPFRALGQLAPFGDADSDTRTSGRSWPTAS